MTKKSLVKYTKKDFDNYLNGKSVLELIDTLTYEKLEIAKIERLVKERERNFLWTRGFERVNPDLELRKLAVNSFLNGNDYFWKNTDIIKGSLHENKPYKKIARELISFIKKEEFTDPTEYLNFLINTSVLNRCSTKEDLINLRTLSTDSFYNGYCFMFNADVIKTEIGKKIYYELKPKFDMKLMKGLLDRYEQTGRIK